MTSKIKTMRAKTISSFEEVDFDNLTKVKKGGKTMKKKTKAEIKKMRLRNLAKARRVLKAKRKAKKK